MKHILKLYEGFTLLEMVVTVGIVALVAIVVSQIFLSTIRTNVKTEISKDMKQNGVLALESIVRMVQRAQSITSPCVAEGTTSQSLTIVGEDSGVTTLECLEDGNAMRLASSSANGVQYLTSEHVTLGGDSCEQSTLTFVCYGSTGVPGSVMMSFQLSKAGISDASFEQSSELFQTTATMRNSSE